MSYMVDRPPSEDKIMQRHERVWEPEKHLPTMTASKSAFRTYSTYVKVASINFKTHPKLMRYRTKNKYAAWEPEATRR